MAITNAQQYQQLMQNGGRIGLRGGGRDMAGVADSKGNVGPSASSGSIGKGNTAREQGIMNRGLGPKGTTQSFDRGPTEIIGGKSFDLNPQSKEAIEQKNFAISIANDKKRTAARKRALKERTFLEKLGKLGYTDRTLDTKLEKIGAIDPQGFTIGGVKVPSSINALSEFTVDPSTNYFDEDSIREIGGVLSKSETGITKSQADTLGDIREDIQMRGRIQDPNDNVTQSEFEEYMNRNKIEDIGGDDGPQDPCKGPNPPAYCFVGIRSAEAATPEVEEDEIINYRLMADGGRAAFAGGGKDAGAGSNFGSENFGGDNRGPAELGLTTRGPKTRSGDGPIGSSVFDELNKTAKIEREKKLDDFIAANNLLGNNVDEDDDNDNTNAIDTVFSPTVASGLQTVFGTGLDKRTDMYDRVLEADGGRIGLAEGGMPYEGGIMDLETSRQMYGLGKLVKKITRGVKKVAKSPIGKAALIAAGGYYLGGGSFLGAQRAGMSGFKFANLPGFTGARNFLMGKPLAFKTAGDSVARSKGFLDFIGGKAGTGILGTTALSYLMTPKEEDEDETLYAGADIDDPRFIMANPSKYTNPRLMAEGGSTEEPVAKKTMPLLDMDGQEMDLRAEGGFVPLGRMERADDVPARLSKNEFVFTADAVRNAGEGDVDKGAEVMYNMMKNLESGGEVSEESQGLEGARDMFQTSQRLEEVL